MFQMGHALEENECDFQHSAVRSSIHDFHVVSVTCGRGWCYKTHCMVFLRDICIFTSEKQSCGEEEKKKSDKKSEDWKEKRKQTEKIQII